MTNKEKYAAAMLASAFIDFSTQQGLEVLNDTLNTLLITFDELKKYINSFPNKGDARYIAYGEIRKLSSDDKVTVRNIICNAYFKGGKQGTEHAAFYFKEIVEECDLANVRI